MTKNFAFILHITNSLKHLASWLVTELLYFINKKVNNLLFCKEIISESICDFSKLSVFYMKTKSSEMTKYTFLSSKNNTLSEFFSFLFLLFLRSNST